jgi:taurine dioxygenase
LAGRKPTPPTLRYLRHAVLDYATEVEIVGLDPQEGSELIEQLRSHLHQPQFYYQHKWSVGDIVY